MNLQMIKHDCKKCDHIRFTKYEGYTIDSVCGSNTQTCQFKKASFYKRLRNNKHIEIIGMLFIIMLGITSPLWIMGLAIIISNIMGG